MGWVGECSSAAVAVVFSIELRRRLPIRENYHILLTHLRRWAEVPKSHLVSGIGDGSRERGSYFYNGKNESALDSELFWRRPSGAWSHLAEYERTFELISEAIADYLALSYEQEIEGDWIVFTVSQKE